MTYRNPEDDAAQFEQESDQNAQQGYNLSHLGGAASSATDENGLPNYLYYVAQASAAHEKQYGKPFNRTWNSDAAMVATKAAIDKAYQDALAQYNQQNGTNYQVNPEILGPNSTVGMTQWQAGNPEDHKGSSGFLSGALDEAASFGKEVATKFVFPAAMAYGIAALGGGLIGPNGFLSSASGLSTAEAAAISDAGAFGGIANMSGPELQAFLTANGVTGATAAGTSAAGFIEAGGLGGLTSGAGATTGATESAAPGLDTVSLSKPPIDPVDPSGMGLGDLSPVTPGPGADITAATGGTTNLTAPYLTGLDAAGVPLSGAAQSGGIIQSLQKALGLTPEQAKAVSTAASTTQGASLASTISKVLAGTATSAEVAGLVKDGLTVAGALGLLGTGNVSAGSTAADTAANIALDNYNFYKQNYQPLERNLIAQATAAGSPEEFARARGVANADVTGAFDKAGKQTASRLQSYGLNPGAPAYQAALGSTDLAQAAAGAGAQTMADRNTRDTAWAKQFDVANMGKGLPSQAVGALNQSAAAQNQSAVTNANLSAAQAKQMGYGLDSAGRLIGDAASWFNTGSSNPTSTYGADNVFSPNGSTGKAADSVDWDIGFAKGGAVGLDSVLSKRGFHPKMREKAITPHMRRFAGGGGVGMQGMSTPDNSNMGDPSQTSQVINGAGTGTSDSIPATIDGQQPAALSDGEFVINAEVPQMTGAEILTAINDAGLKKRQTMGLENAAPQTSNQVSVNAGMQAYGRGGRVNRTACGLGA